MAFITEVKAGKSSSDAETHEVDTQETREPTQILIKPNSKNGAMAVIESFKQHPDEKTEFAHDEGRDLLDHLKECLDMDWGEEGEEEESN